MLSPEILSANLDAINRAQGACPTLGALRDTVRVTIAGGTVNVEMNAGGEWRVIDAPAAAEGIHWVDENLAGASQAIVVGAALGYAVDRAQQIGVKKIVAIEPDPGLATLFLSRRDWREPLANGRLRLLTGPDYRGIADAARFLDGLLDINIVSHPVRAAVEPESSAKAAAVAEHIAQNARSNGTARRKFAGPYLLQTLTNLPTIAREGDVRALADAFTGVPAIVVGAGPSLDQNLHDLPAVQSRAVIVATDTTLGPLLSAGVRPHIVVGIDSSALNAQHLTTPRGSGDVMLVAEGSLHPSAFRPFEGRIFSFRVADHEPWPWLRAAGLERGELRAWGSVLTSAFDLACRMGCNPIVFAGADLAFTGMRPYCRGTIYDAQWQEWIDRGCTWQQLMDEYFSRQPEVYREDVHGRRIRTAPNLVSFRDWLVERIHSLRSTTVVNATGDGILHGGSIRQASLREALDGMPSVPGVRETLRDKRAASCATAAGFAALGSAAESARRHMTLPVQRWIDFTAATVSEEDILEAFPGSVQ